MNPYRLLFRYDVLTGAVLAEELVPTGVAVPVSPSDYVNFVEVDLSLQLQGSLYRIDLNTMQPVLKSSLPYTLSKSQVVADGMDEITLTVPAGTMLFWPDGEITITTGASVSFSVDEAGDEVIRAEHPLYLTVGIEYEGVPA